MGAVQLLPEAEQPQGFGRIEGVPLSEGAVEHIIAANLSPVGSIGGAPEDDFRISIAGVQEKTALLYHDGRWQKPLGATPTTHILKLPMGRVGILGVDMSHSVENEWLCLQLIQAMGLPTAKAEMRQFGKRRVLVVKRFDRRLHEGWIARVPQEDFCQALGVPSSLKYESDGGPGMRDILRVLDSGAKAAVDKQLFLKAQMVFWMLAATDGHAKNFSIFIGAGGQYRMTPFYDVLSAWPVIGRGAGLLDFRKVKLAMAVRSKSAHWKLSEIRARTWDVTAQAVGLEAERLLHEITLTAPRAVEKVAAKLNSGFPAELSDSVFEGFLKMVRTI
ncbi:HipA domain-containing protein [Cephaloticoccus primus]|uniref:HipA domain-containing protein n=1 Tax=Cephaloticoccus primus TaxID=1548207 RepID=UPI000A564FC1|nr:HipA domain-containing protein [Cephaloticoccus primus]